MTKRDRGKRPHHILATQNIRLDLQRDPAKVRQAAERHEVCSAKVFQNKTARIGLQTVGGGLL